MIKKNTLSKAILTERGFIWLTFSSYSLLFPGSQGRNLRQLVTQMQRIMLPTMGWVVSYQSITKPLPHSMPTGQTKLDNPSCSPSFQKLPQTDKTNYNTYWAGWVFFSLFKEHVYLLLATLYSQYSYNSIIYTQILYQSQNPANIHSLMLSWQCGNTV